MLQASSLSKSFGGRTLFEDVTFSIGRGEIVGLVGRNGCGKSTLFKVLLGEEGYDSGSLSIPKDYKLGHLDQHIHFTQGTVLEECCQVLSEDEKWDFYKAEKILFGLGFNQETIYQDPRSLSGGYQLRVNLTKCLLQNPDLLLLDEPTNYLDLPSLRWMQKFLSSLRREVIIITHDRGFMDSVSTHTMGLHRGRLLKLSGNTHKYYEQLAINEEVYEKSREKQEKKIKHLQSFVDRFRAQAAKATLAQSKLKQIERMDKLEELQDEADMRLQFRYKPTSAKKLMDVKDLSFSFDPDSLPLFDKLNFELKAGECLAIIGKNGKGKTTLLNAMAGDLKPTNGEIVFHPDVALGYYQQTNRKNLNPKRTVAEEISYSNNDLTISQTRAICGAMMFSGDDADKKIEVLSGGEQGRVLLGKILANPANVLFLDEPTNHLDMYSIDIMIEELKTFPGAVAIVTHSEEILRTLATKFIIFNRGKVELFLGTYDEFLEKVGWEDEDPPKAKSQQKTDSAKSFEDNKQKSRNDKKQQKFVEQLEADILKTEGYIQTLNEELIELSTSPQNANRITELGKLIAEAQKALDSLYKDLDHKA